MNIRRLLTRPIFNSLYYMFMVFEGRLSALRRILGILKSFYFRTLVDIRQPFLQYIMPVDSYDNIKIVTVQHFLGAWAGINNVQPVTVIYVHGGGFISGDLNGFLNIIEKLSIELNCPVFMPEYSLLPEHTFQDIYNEMVLSIEHVISIQPNNKICFMGDSAGAGLICYCINELIVRNVLYLERIHSCVLFSPMIDIRNQYAYVDHDVYISKQNLLTCKTIIRTCSDAYTYEPLQYRLDKFPPTYVSVSSDEILLYDSLWLCERLRDAQLKIYPKYVHSFILFWSYVPEFYDEFKSVLEFITKINI